MRPRNAAASMFVLAFASLPAPPASLAGDDPPGESSAELKKLQGLWQTSPGGIEHRDGKQVVRQPAPGGPCFFIVDDRLIWLDEEGKPSGREARITLDVQAEPKRITLTPIGDEGGGKPTRGIYSASGSALRVHLGVDGGAAPKQFLELNKPTDGVDGQEWLVSRKKLRDR